MTVPATNLLPLPVQLVTPVTTLQNDLQNGLNNAGLVVANISASDAAVIYADALAVETTAAPLIAQADATVASPAFDAASSAGVAAVIVEKPKHSVQFLHVVNPDFFELAARYLGDATLWENIVQASGLPYDPQPIGAFNVIVPSV